MKKICFVSYGYLYVDPRMLNMANSFKNQGWDVVAINIRRPGLCESTHDRSFDKLHQCINIDSSILKNSQKSHHINFKFLNTIFKHAELVGEKIDALKRKLFHITNYPLIDSLKKFVEHPLFLESTKDVDVFYGCEFYHGTFIAYFASILKNKKFIFDIKEFYADMNPESSSQEINLVCDYEPRFISRSMVLPCVSQGIIDLYIKKYPKLEGKFQYVPNASAHLETPQKKPGKLKFVMFATYVPHVRGIEFLIKLWEFLRPQNASLTLYLGCIDNKSKASLETLMPATYNKSLFIDQLDHADHLNTVLLQYDIGIIPYLPEVCLNHKFCSPGKFGQYVKAGLMILSSDTENIKKYVNGNNLGLVYSTGDLTKACETFNQILSGKADIQAYKNNVQEFFKSSYHWERFFNNLYAKMTSDNIPN